MRLYEQVSRGHLVVSQFGDDQTGQTDTHSHWQSHTGWCDVSVERRPNDRMGALWCVDRPVQSTKRNRQLSTSFAKKTTKKLPNWWTGRTFTLRRVRKQTLGWQKVSLFRHGEFKQPCHRNYTIAHFICDSHTTEAMFRTTDSADSVGPSDVVEFSKVGHQSDSRQKCLIIMRAFVYCCWDWELVCEPQGWKRLRISTLEKGVPMTP